MIFVRFPICIQIMGFPAHERQGVAHQAINNLCPGEAFLPVASVVFMRTELQDLAYTNGGVRGIKEIAELWLAFVEAHCLDL